MIHFGIEAALIRSTDTMIKYANKNRVDHSFKIGDLVWLLVNIRIHPAFHVSLFVR